MPRRTRVTLRCITDDFHLPIPESTVDLADLDHPLVVEAARVAAASPRGQKRIEAIESPLIYRIRSGQHRGATWLEQRDPPPELLWLLAAALRHEGDRSDAYEYFVRLASAGTLLPTTADYLRLRVEAAGRLLDTCIADMTTLLRRAEECLATEVSAVLGGFMRARAVFVSRDGYHEVWLALGVDSVSGDATPVALRDTLFASAREILHAEACDAVYAWPGRRLSGHEIARLYLR